MTAIVGFVVRSMSDSTIRAIVMWTNCLIMAVASVACGVAAAVWMPEAQAMWYSWCTLTGIASVACALAFFMLVMG